MALDQLTLAPTPPTDPDSDHASLHSRILTSDAADDSAKVPRLPRWTRQEILVLIQGKRVVENRARRGRTAGLAFGSGQVEPKWASVSSYCKRHGVSRGPVQCRKRWSNLAGDFKKIKDWESQIRDETDSFWVMRNDLRRERKLPGFFDREVYDILDGGGGDDAEEDLVALGLGSGSVSAPVSAMAVAAEGGEEGQTEVEPVFDSGRRAAADDGLFSDLEQSVQHGVGLLKETPVCAVPAPTPISEQYQPFSHGHVDQGTSYEKQPSSNPETESNQKGVKRKRHDTEGDEKDEAKFLHEQVIEAMERNGRLLSSHLESQNMNLQLEREQRKDHVNSLISVLNKLADAMGRIADKL